MKLRFTVLATVLFLTAHPLAAWAQDSNGSAGTSANSQVQELKQRIDQQDARIKLLDQLLSSQNELIERQRTLLETLQQTVEQAQKTVPVPAAVYTSSGTAGATNSTPPSPPEEKAAVTSTARAVRSVETGYGKIKFNGLLQGWYSAGNQSIRDTFRLRRAELKFSGEITPKARWTVMIDPSKGLSLNNSYTTIDGTRLISDTSVNQSSRILQDAFITFDYNKRVQINVGQFKVPLSLEGLQSSATLETIERAMFLADRPRGGAYGDVRDLGLMIYGPLSSAVDYQLGVFNGSGENHNDLDKNDQKAVAGRLVVRVPFVKGLQIGGSGVWGNGTGPDRPRRDRAGAEVLFRRDAFVFKSEVMAGTDSDLHRLGYYSHFGYRFRPKLEGVFRFDSWDPDTHHDTSSANVVERDFIGGLNYYLTENNVKLQFNYVRKTFAGAIVPSRNLLLVNLQTSW